MTQPNNADPQPQTILVTGGSGYVAGHLIATLLKAGHHVRTTVRSQSKQEAVHRATLDADVDSGDRLAFVTTDLTRDDGWEEAMRGITFVHHVASPFPPSVPKDEDDVIRPAREGVLRVLRFARDAGVKRVVLTSSFAAIGYGHEINRPFTEADWSVLDGKITVPAYHKSKTLAEKAAWEFVQENSQGPELVAVNPTGIFGPMLNAELSSSIRIIQTMLEGGMAACPQVFFGVVDVRDLVDFHIRAMNDPRAKDERFIVTGDDGPQSFISIANMIRQGRPQHAQHVPTKQLPNLVTRATAIFKPQLRPLCTELGVIKTTQNGKAKTLGWEPRPTQETINDTADSLIRHKVIKSDGTAIVSKTSS